MDEIESELRSRALKEEISKLETHLNSVFNTIQPSTERGLTQNQVERWTQLREKFMLLAQNYKNFLSSTEDYWAALMELKTETEMAAAELEGREYNG